MSGKDKAGMKEKNLFKAGITLFMEQQKETQSIRYRAEVYDVTDTEVHISPLVNTENNREKATVQGEEFTCYFVAADQVYYRFPTSITTIICDPVRALGFPIPDKEELQRIQRREYVRVEAKVDTATSIHGQPFLNENFVTIDVSGGGCSFALPKGKQYFPGTVFDCCFALPFQKGMEFLSAKVRLVRTDYTTTPHRLCCSFVDIPEQDRNCMLQFVFEQQVERRNQANS